VARVPAMFKDIDNVIILNVYKPEQWHDFFLLVGGGAAALAGLVFVAMSISLDAIIQDSTHRHRAIGTLAGFTAAFMICALALIGEQTSQTIGVGWLVVSGIAGAVYINGYVEAMRTGRSSAGLNLSRLVPGTACYVAQMVGSSLLIAGYISGLYIAAVAMVIYFAFMVSGAWLLIVGARQSRTNQ
jgi:hypothetical protein